MGYSRDGAPSIYPLHQTLALPARSFSYELKRRLVKATVQNPFHESVEAVADLTGVAVPKRGQEEILRDASLDFDAFYQERAPEPASGSILVAALDGKGIPMVKPGGAQTSVRLTKGQKAKQEENGHRGRRVHLHALGPHPRTGCGKPVPYRTSDARRRADAPGSGEQAGMGQFAQRRTAIIEEVAQEMQREKLRKAAYMFHVEGSLEAELWVLDRTPRILFGDVSQVVKGIRERHQRRALWRQAQDAVRRCRLPTPQPRSHAL
jgi:hypothetical protein